MTYDLSTIGEGQLRFTVPHGERLADARSLRVCAAGSEANVAGLLSQLGRPTAWTTVLPEGDLGDRVVSEYRSAGVDVSLVRRVPSGRVATYYLEPAAGRAPAEVTYDRLGTPFRDIASTDVDWDRLLDTRLLFLTGITAALTDATASVVTEAARLAASAGVAVALDVNHRSTLWSAQDAARTLSRLLPSVQTLFCSRRDAASVFGITGEGPDVAVALRAMSGAERVVTTDGATAVHWADATGTGSEPVAPVEVVDRPGAGDALVAGTIHGLLDGDIEGGVRTGIRAAAVALTHHGDLTRFSARDLAASDDADIRR